MAHQSPVTRAAFLYLYDDSRKNTPKLAQCETCMMWTGAHGKHPLRCSILGPAVIVRGTDGCGFWIGGKNPHPDAPPMSAVTPKEAGFERRQFRCENCAFFNDAASRCRLFALLNDMAPRLFALDDRVHPQGCCNANTAIANPGTY